MEELDLAIAANLAVSGRAGRPEACWSEFLSPRESGQKVAGSVLKFCPMSGWIVTGEQGGSRESCFLLLLLLVVVVLKMRDTMVIMTHQPRN